MAMSQQTDHSLTRRIKVKQRFPLVFLAIILSLMILLPHRVWNTIFLAIFGIYGIGYAWIQILKNRLHGSRERRRQWLSVGDELVERFTLHNRSILPATWVELHDESNVPGYRPSVAYMLGPNESVNWRQSAMCVQRGHFFVGPWQLRTGDPFGFFELIVDYGVEDDLLIYPPITTDIPFGLPAGLRPGQTTGQELINQITHNISTVRDYQPGDPIRWVHWPTTARKGTLAVREFDIDAAGDIWILLDVGSENHIGSGISGTEEQAVLIASALVAQGLADNRPVGLATYGTTPVLIHPQKGIAQQWQLLYALAVTHADGELTLAQGLADLKSIIHRGSALIVITPALTPDLLIEYNELSAKEILISTIRFDRQTFGAEEADHPSSSRWQHLAGHKLYTIQQGDIHSPTPDGDQSTDIRVTPMGGIVRVERET